MLNLEVVPDETDIKSINGFKNHTPKFMNFLLSLSNSDEMDLEIEKMRAKLISKLNELEHYSTDIQRRIAV